MHIQKNTFELNWSKPKYINILYILLRTQKKCIIKFLFFSKQKIGKPKIRLTLLTQ